MVMLLHSSRFAAHFPQGSESVLWQLEGILAAGAFRGRRRFSMASAILLLRDDSTRKQEAGCACL